MITNISNLPEIRHYLFEEYKFLISKLREIFMLKNFKIWILEVIYFITLHLKRNLFE